ncbi:MAG: thiamine-phosphate kinase [Candidatus Binatia bacterium]|nr:thiamine-phosphate kinase [Candidatus Binatia bacterium]
MADDDPLEGEHHFLRRLIGRLQARDATPAPSGAARLLLGAGDDAAVFQPGTHPLALTTDALVEGIHFRTDWLDATELGRRAVEVNLSDLAAMAAQPRFLLCAITAPSSTSSEWLDALLDGCADAGEAAGAALIGGNLSRASEITITITALGDIPGRRLDRSGAQAGDDLVVTGTLGDAAAAVAILSDGGRPESEQRNRWARPQARVRAGLALAEAGAHAAIDLSDGLVADLSHVCEASGVGAEIEHAKLPRSAAVSHFDANGANYAATGGEDYELLAACPPATTANLSALAAQAEVPLTVIGRCTERAGEIMLLDSARQALPLTRGFDHFTPEG